MKNTSKKNYTMYIIIAIVTVILGVAVYILLKDDGGNEINCNPSSFRTCKHAQCRMYETCIARLCIPDDCAITCDGDDDCKKDEECYDFGTYGVCGKKF